MSEQKKIVVIGGTGLIGTKAVSLLRAAGHDAVSASPQTGINTLTGEGLSEALAGADAVIDVSNIASFDAETVRNFFETSGKNLMSSEKAANLPHHVTLSIVGVDALASNPYLAGKVVQEAVVKNSGQPYTIVRATQFFEFVPTLADAYTSDGVARVPDILFQPIAADDVAAALVKAVLGAPLNGTINIAGPKKAPFKDFVKTQLEFSGDKRVVDADAAATYFGAAVSETSLVPTGSAELGATTHSAWLQAQKSLQPA